MIEELVKYRSMNDHYQDTLHQYRRLVDISRDLASMLDLELLLERIIHSAAELSDSEAASILLYDEQKQHLRFHAATNIKSDAPIFGMIVPKHSLAGWVALHREPVIVADVHKDKRWFQNVGEELAFPTQSIIAVPLIAKDNLIGVLEALNKRNGPFTEKDQEILSVLGAQAAVAIENTRLFQQTDLIAEFVHELRTPLTSISTVAHLLQRTEISDVQHTELARTIQQEIQRLSELATNFLDLARLESGRSSFEKTSFSLQVLIEECSDLSQPEIRKKELELILDIAPQLPELNADRDKIKQVLLNLLSNAVKYNRPGGKIYIKAGMRDKQAYIISVQDTGLGMAPEDLQHLFERFFRVHAESAAPGSGLGLSICKRIVEGHAGEIRVESEPNMGTTFHIILPR